MPFPDPRPVWRGGPMDLAVYVRRRGRTDAQMIEVAGDQVRTYLERHPPQMGPTIGGVSPQLLEATVAQVSYGTVHPKRDVAVMTREALIFQMGHIMATFRHLN